MKPSLALAWGGLFLLVLSMGGCVGFASYNPPFSTARVGPVPLNPSHGPPGTGTLFVYTATTQTTDRTGYIIASPQNYRLQSADGTWQGVSNANPLNPSPEPRPVYLAPGDYRVEALADLYRAATVPVRIEAGRTTIVNLLDAPFPGPRPAGAPGKMVRGPTGAAIGWPAD